MDLAVWAGRNGVALVAVRATTRPIFVDKVVTKVGSVLNGHRRKFLALLRDRSVGRIVVEYWDRFCRFGSEYVWAVLAAQGCGLVVVDSSGVDDDLMGAWLCGERAAQNRAQRAVAAGLASGNVRRCDGKVRDS